MKGEAMARNKVTTTIGLPITGKKEDQVILRKLDRLKVKRGFRNRTDLLRILICEEWGRVYPNTKGGPK
jgi:hypothetical protein